MKHFLLVDAMNIDGIPMVPTGDFNVLPSDSCLVDFNKMQNFNRHSCRFMRKAIIIVLALLPGVVCSGRGYVEPKDWPKAGGTDIVPSETVLLYPEGQESGRGIVEGGIEVTRGAREANGLDGPENCNWKGTLTNVGDYARMDLYFPAKPNGQMAIVCPGGGYTHLSAFNEGVYVAEWLVEHGIAACILKYRLPNGHRTVPIDDVQNAFRYCRFHAAGWGVKQIGVIGFSAGGHLASAASVFFEDDVTRPDFAVLVYPRIAQQPGAHSTSMDELIGKPELWKQEIASAKDPSAKQLEYERLQYWFCTDNSVRPDTPETFIAQSSDDRTVPPLNFVGYYEALMKLSIPAEVHVYPEGGHGWGFGDSRYKGPGTDKFASFRQVFYDELALWLAKMLEKAE